MPPSFSFTHWISAVMPQPSTVDPIYAAVIKWLRGEMGVRGLGGVGYCFGGKYVCRWLKKGGLDAGFIAHPSFVTREEVQGIGGALSIAAAGMLITPSSITQRDKQNVMIVVNDLQKSIPSSRQKNATKQKTYSETTPCRINSFSTQMLSTGMR
jgi:dienelactone hydrolase